jgi:urease accessory protein
LEESTWELEASLGFGLAGGRTVLKRIRTLGPLHVRRLFHPEPAGEDGIVPAQAYLIHPPGGMVSGDSLRASLRLEEGARVLMSTPSAGKFYQARPGSLKASQTVRALVEKDAVLEWLPLETIIYRGARAESSFAFELASGARLVFWDMLSFGRPASGEIFDRGSFSESLEIRRNGRLLALERLRIGGREGFSLLNSLEAFNKLPCLGVLMALGGGDGEDLQKLIRARDEIRATNPGGEGNGFFSAVTLKEDLLIVRALSSEMEPLKDFLLSAWKKTRLRLLSREAVVPRAWRC